MSDGGVYQESPFGRIVNCHFKENKPPPNCHSTIADGYTAEQLKAAGFPLPPIVCGNTYSTGGIVVNDGVSPAFIQPFGDCVQPIVGSYPTLGQVGPPLANGTPGYGGLGRGYQDADGKVIDETVTPPGNIGGTVSSLHIDASGLTFLAPYIVPNAVVIPQPGGTGTFLDQEVYWRVPMAEGSVCRNLKAGLFATLPDGSLARDANGNPIPLPPEWSPVPVVVDEITLTVEVGPSGESFDPYDVTWWGIGLAHVLLAGQGGAANSILIPPEPLVVLDGHSGIGASGSLTYKLRQKKWDDFYLSQQLSGGFTFDTTNNFDPELGGPAFFLFMENRAVASPGPLPGNWNTFGDTFFPFTMLQGHPNVSIRWTATCTCIPYTEAT